MENVSLKLNTNWKPQSGGDKDISTKIQTKLADDYIEKPDIGDLINEEYAFIVSKPQSGTASDELVESYNACEMQIALFPRYKIASFHIICSAPKMEVFQGCEKEYMETEHGVLVEDNVNDGEDDGSSSPLNSYRYDVEVKKSGIHDLTLRFLTNHEELCIFGFLLQIIPNPNGITSLMPSAINLEKVQQMLEGAKTKSAPGMEKYKIFMEAYGRRAMSGNNQPVCSSPMVNNATTTTTTSTSQGDINTLKKHIDERLKEMETRIFDRLDQIQKESNLKLEAVLKLLENKQIQ